MTEEEEENEETEIKKGEKEMRKGKERKKYEETVNEIMNQKRGV
jgi:hypothetical protein